MLLLLLSSLPYEYDDDDNYDDDYDDDLLFSLRCSLFLIFIYLFIIFIYLIIYQDRSQATMATTVTTRPTRPYADTVSPSLPPVFIWCHL